jgi:hypothetical protein
VVVCDTPFVHEAAILGAVAAFPDAIGFEDSPDLPVRCHYGRPEDAKKCAAVFQGTRDAWATQIDRIGFPAPEPDDDGILDVYIDPDYRAGAYAVCTSGHRDAIADDGFTGCPAHIVLGWSIPEPAIAAFMAHEFNHVSQYAIDWKEWSLPIWEGVATAAAYWTYPDIPPYSTTVGDYQAASWLGIVGDGYFLRQELGLGSWFEYGSVAWVLHLDAAYGTGDGTVGGLALWLNATQPGARGGNTTTVLDSYQAITGDWIQALMDFDIQRVRIATRSNPPWIPWAERPARMPLGAGMDAASLPTIITPAIAPYATGVTYEVVTGVPAGHVLHVEAQTLDAEWSWGILAVQGAESGWDVADTFDWTSTGEEKIVVGVVNLEQDEFATTGDFDDLRAGQSTLSVALSIEPPTGADTGVDDTAAPAPDSGGSPEGGRTGKKGCGCNSPPPVVGWVVPLVLAGGILRRKNRFHL